MRTMITRTLKTTYAVLAIGAMALALLVGFAYLTALVVGGNPAEAVIDAAGTLQSLAIYTASMAMLCALMSMYAEGRHHLRVESDGD